jgi:hypothetical protein
MRTLPDDISDAERAVHHYKGELLKKVMAHILRRALLQAYVSAGDVPEEIVEKEHRQGVASNAWNALRSLEIIEAVPMKFTDEAAKIFGGRIQNENPGRKGAWVTAYRLASRAKAIAWANANQLRLSEAELTATTPLMQPDLLAA